MLDHVFTDAIGALRDALEGALLERQAFEERFQVDVLLGDVTWETSYGLPGEGSPPRVQADITLDWPTWSQTAYRSWYLDDTLDKAPEDPPEVLVEVSLRVQRMAERPDPGRVLAVLPEASPPIGTEALTRSGHTVEHVFEAGDGEGEFAIEVAYEGSVALDEHVMADGSILDERFGGIGGWIASTLVRLGDIAFSFLPPEH
ncbi:MAG TPA: hypothetical protein VNT56_02225 [Acidimicrobiales bacterium]|jgi:hypothetical protein|nr:hypothetical protein [Acidimicrobiales bacterium]